MVLSPTAEQCETATLQLKVTICPWSHKTIVEQNGMSMHDQDKTILEPNTTCNCGNLMPKQNTETEISIFDGTLAHSSSSLVHSDSITDRSLASEANLWQKELVRDLSNRPDVIHCWFGCQKLAMFFTLLGNRGHKFPTSFAGCKNQHRHSRIPIDNQVLEPWLHAK